MRSLMRELLTISFSGETASLRPESFIEAMTPRISHPKVTNIDEFSRNLSLSER